MDQTHSFENGFEAIAAIIPKAFVGLRSYLQSSELLSAVRIAHRNLICEKAGWLLHYTTPLHLITDNMTPEDVGPVLEQYYRENWTDLEFAFRRELQKSNIDDEAKSAFDEALRAHGLGLYRCSVRTVFPEIERLARVYLHDGKMNGLASLREVRLAIGELGWSELRSARDGPVFLQFAVMAHHLYEKVDTTESFAKFSSTPIPNRHAAVHGLISYGSLQSSIAALIMMEFMFQMISFIKERRELA